MNKIKDKQKYPKCLEYCNISGIWKTKKNWNSFESIFWTILDKLIYIDKYKNLDKNLTDANVGARKKHNIRYTTFVLNATINSIRNEKEEALDMQVYDIEKCDTLWLHKVINSLYEVGVKNDKLPLLILENWNAQVAIKTNGRVTKTYV